MTGRQRLGIGRPAGERGALKLMATDGPDRFAAVGTRFLAESVEARDVEVVDL